VARRRRERYIDRWRREHPDIHIYLTRPEYEYLRKVSEATGMSVKELVLGALKDINSLRERLVEVAILEVFECLANWDSCDDDTSGKIVEAGDRYGFEYMKWKVEDKEEYGMYWILPKRYTTSN
jgi:hypothetical protein